jgi:hypothetical protein
MNHKVHKEKHKGHKNHSDERRGVRLAARIIIRLYKMNVGAKNLSPNLRA